jgi:hypothetical protein
VLARLKDSAVVEMPYELQPLAPDMPATAVDLVVAAWPAVRSFLLADDRVYDARLVSGSVSPGHAAFTLTGLGVGVHDCMSYLLSRKFCCFCHHAVAGRV